MQFSPRDYQKPITDKIVSDHSAFIIATMGAGKTASTLDGISRLFDEFEVARVLIVAPLRVASHTWPSEVAKWDSFNHLTTKTAIGSPAKRHAAIAAGAQLTFINRENIPWLVKEYGKKWPFDMVVIDESSSFKNSSSQRFKAFKKVRKFVDRWVLLTGTPTPNSLLEIWSQVFLLDGGERLGRAYSAFRSRYFESDYMGYKFTPRPGADKQIHDAVADLCVVVEKYDGLPDRVDLTESVQLPKKARDQYDEMVRELIIEMGDDEITAVNAAVLVGKLQQLCNGAIYNEAGDVVEVHDEKLNALDDLLEQSEGENVLIAYNYKHDLTRIKARYPDAVDIKEDGAIDRWNAGKIRMLLAHPASAGHGLNLQDGGNRIIWLSPTWSTELKLQFDARLHRQGQQKPVFIHTITVDESVDGDIIEAVTHKKSVQDILIDAVKKT